MTLIRIFATSMVTVTHQFRTDGALTDAGGAVTATVKRLDGTGVASGTASRADVGTYTYAVTSAALDAQTLDWSGSVGGSTVTVRDRLEYAGGFLFGLDEARETLSLPATVTDAVLARRRIQVEQECERICRRAFVPRFQRDVLNGSNSPRLALSKSEIRAIRAVTVDGVALGVSDMAALGYTAAGILVRPNEVIWPLGWHNIVVEYEHGWDLPPEDLSDANMLRLRSFLPRARSGVPDRTTSYTDQTGSTYRLAIPTLDSTGIPDIDGAYMKYARYRRPVTA